MTRHITSLRRTAFAVLLGGIVINVVSLFFWTPAVSAMEAQRMYTAAWQAGSTPLETTEESNESRIVSHETNNEFQFHAEVLPLLQSHTLAKGRLYEFLHVLRFSFEPRLIFLSNRQFLI